jgi:hypothetical protein
MGRSKQNCPKRRRLNENEDDDKQKQVAAIAVLQTVPQEQVELAAADATRIDLHAPSSQWIHYVHSNICDSAENNDNNSDRNIQAGGTTSKPTTVATTTEIPRWLNGLGASRSVANNHFDVLQRLHEYIKTKANDKMTSWSGSIDDPRRRAFGFLPQTLGYHPSIRNQLDISMPFRTRKNKNNDNSDESTKNDNHDDSAAEDEEEHQERRRNEKAVVLLDEIPDGVEEAIEHVCRLFRDCLRKAETTSNDDHKKDKNNHASLLEFLQYRHLIAVQPNLHCGRALLPIHLDHPQKDGFGIIIVTIAIKGSGKVLLQDISGDNRLAMSVRRGEAYMLSHLARDACVHGVLADIGHDDRESLNLRFGLHDMVDSSSERDTKKKNVIGNNDVPLPVIPSRQVLQYWET